MLALPWCNFHCFCCYINKLMETLHFSNVLLTLNRYEPFLKKDFPCPECKLDINPFYRHLLWCWKQLTHHVFYWCHVDLWSAHTYDAPEHMCFFLMSIKQCIVIVYLRNCGTCKCIVWLLKLFIMTKVNECDLLCHYPHVLMHMI